ncbi:MAG TPA: lipoate--protein ligase [Clostridia bacterium]|nr:lipoate--protein ligase [Clostridia bacterium]
MNGARIIHTSTKDPWWNLAVEEFLLTRVEPGQCILYLWQNQNTVVIGRNQNPWRECRTELLESEGGKLARRLSGGGAVFHDLGNLNFTFIADKKEYNQEKQLETILNAVKALGIEAEKSGRNDLTADGRKFSGNAFYIRGDRAYHHGTILVSADFEKLARYLQVSEDKMKSKGIKSVQSRVVNLTELMPGLTVETTAQALISSFRSIYGCTVPVEYSISDRLENREAIEELYSRYSSWEWRYGETTGFDVELENRFIWGGVQIGLKIENGIISEAKVFSDAMEEAYIEALPGIFEGCPYDSGQLARRLTDAAGTIPKEGAGAVSEAGEAVCVSGGSATGSISDLGAGYISEAESAGFVSNVGAGHISGAESAGLISDVGAVLTAGCISADSCRRMTLDLAEWLANRNFNCGKTAGKVI